MANRTKHGPVRLLFGSAARHPLMLTLSLGLGLLGGVELIRILPHSYHVECRLLAQRNLVMPALGNPKRAVPADSDAPTQAVSETVLTRENLVGMIKHTDLLERWESERAPLLKLKDRLTRQIGPPPTESHKLEALIGVLEKSIAFTTDEASVTLSIDWPNARTAADLLQVAQENFLAARHAAEVQKIADTIRILQEHAVDVRANIDSTFAQLQHARQQAHAAESGDVGRERELTLIQRKVFPESLREPKPRSVLGRDEEKEAESDDQDDPDAHEGLEEKKRVEYPKARLKIAFDNYDDLKRRVEAARIELDTAEAAFKYRYRVIQPVVVPEKPTTPNRPVLIGGLGLFGLLLGLGLALTLDLRGDHIRAAWQIEHHFRVRVLAEVEGP